VKSGPEVSFVGMATLLSCARKRLTGTGAGPHGAAPSGKIEGVVPAPDAGKEVDALVSGKVVRPNIDN
jgi:hypothetical protein